MRKLIPWLVILLFVKCDSISKETNSTVIDEQFHLADSIYEYGDKFYYKNQFDSAIYYYHLALGTVGVHMNYSKYSNITNDIGLSYKKTGEIDSAYKYYHQALEIDYSNEDTVKIMGRWRNLGILFNANGQYTRAIQQYQEALKLAKASSRPYPNLENVIGQVYSNLDLFDSSKVYMRRAEQGYLKLNDSTGVAYAYNNLGGVFEREENWDSALYYYQLALTIKKEKDTASLSSTLTNIGSIFLENNQPDSAKDYLHEAYERRKNAKDQRGLAYTSHSLSEYSMQIDEYKDALTYLDYALAYAKESNNRTVLQRNHQLRSKLYKATGDFEKSLNYLDRWSKMRESVFNIEKINTLQRQSSFDLEESERNRQIANNEAQIASVKASRNLYIALIVSLFFLTTIGFTIAFYRQRKALAALNEELDTKNEKINALNKQNFHFTKNSLAGVVSTLNIQISQSKDEKIKNTLIAEKIRMETINLLYRQLFAQPDLEKFAVKPYLETTVSNTMDSILGFGHDVKSEFELDEIYLPNERAMSLGMIVNEICLNSCKYSFLSGYGDVLVISLTTIENSIQLVVSDNGNGLPKDVNWKSADSFGLQMIRLLAQDLKASLSIDSSEEGLIYKLTIPI